MQGQLSYRVHMLATAVAHNGSDALGVALTGSPERGTGFLWHMDQDLKVLKHEQQILRSGPCGRRGTTDTIC